MPDLSKELADGVREAFQPLLDTLLYDFVMACIFLVWAIGMLVIQYRHK